MCHYKLVRFACIHAAYGPKINHCEAQNLSPSQVCQIKETHPLHTIALQRPCQICQNREVKRPEAEGKVEDVLSKAKFLLKEMNERVGKLQRAKREPKTDEGQLSPIVGFGPEEERMLEILEKAYIRH